MLTDRYGLSVGTQSAPARDAYAEGVDLLVAACPGSAAGFDRALAEDPAFALAHLAKARSMQLAGNLPAMRESFDQAQTQLLLGRFDVAAHAFLLALHLFIAQVPKRAADGGEKHDHRCEWPQEGKAVLPAGRLPSPPVLPQQADLFDC